MNDARLADLERAARHWVTTYPFNSRHLTRSLEWLDRLAPRSRAAVRLAALTHDMERAFPGADQPLPARLNEDGYYQAHSERSARIVSAWLVEQAAAQPPDEPEQYDELVRDVAALVRVHEFGGWPEANLVQAADSLSFLETNVDLFLGFARAGRYPVKDIAAKFQWMCDRIQIEDAKTMARPMLAEALRRLGEVNEEIRGGGVPIGDAG